MRLNIGEATLPPTTQGQLSKRPFETSPLREGDTLVDGWGVTWVVTEMHGYEEAVIRPIGSRA